MKLRILLFGLAMALAVGVQAQKKVQFQLNLGGSLPIGDFGKIHYNSEALESDCGIFDPDTKGGASFGFNFGTELYVPLYIDNMDFALSLDFHCNGLAQEAKTYMNDFCSYMNDLMKQEIITGGRTYIASYLSTDKTPHYLNIPLFVGLKYHVPLKNENFGICAELGIGSNIRFITPWVLSGDFSFKENGYVYKMHIMEKNSYNTTFSFAFRTGLGFNFSNHLSISMWYYYLGKGDVSMKSYSEASYGSGTPSTNIQNATLEYINPQLFVAKIGYTF